ncbi:MAG TPA: 2-phospho-L-lactate transferase CofD family protein, partial [Synergistales bacterium]|nr:2-phospho-L-lactate transferase CofD family protein [Synergistales bacterium]
MNWWSAFTIGFLTGGIIALLGARLFQEEVEEGAGESQDKKNGSVMTKAFLHKVSQGPEIVAIGGGTGLSTLLSGLKYYTRNITAIVTVTDEGGSSGRLRGEWGVLPPGDIRNCMLALAEDD